MKSVRNILSVLLAVGLAAAGLPGLSDFHEPVGSGADLLNVVRGVADLSKTADYPDNFEENVIKMLNAFRAAAGLETVYKSNSSHGIQSPRGLDQPFLSAKGYPTPGNPIVFELNEITPDYDDVSPSPAFRPPRTC